MCGLSALRASGRFNVMVAVCPSTSYLMVSYDVSDMCSALSVSGSSALELRGAAVPERRQALFEICGTTGQFDVVEFVVHGLGQRGLLAEVQSLFGQADRDRRPAGQP